MKLRQLFDFDSKLATVSNIPHTKLSYAITKNRGIISKALMPYRYIPNAESIEYWEAMRLQKGVLTEEQQEKYKTVIEKLREDEKKFEEMLDQEEIDLDMIHKVSKEELPHNLTVSQLDILSIMID